MAVSGRGLVDPDEPVLTADDEGFTRGRAAFETMRVYRGRPFRLQQHLARLAASAERIGLEVPDRREVENLAVMALEHAGLSDAVLRLYWTPGSPGGVHRAIALVSTIPGVDRGGAQQGQRLVSLVHQRRSASWLLPATKSTSYAVSMAAEAEAKARGADDAVFVDADGIVLEGPVTNIWWREGETLLTPSLEVGILAGETSAALLELAASERTARSSRASIRSSGSSLPTRCSHPRRSGELMPVVDDRRPSVPDAARCGGAPDSRCGAAAS